MAFSACQNRFSRRRRALPDAGTSSDLARANLEPDTAREAAREAWKLMKRGINPKDRLRELELGGPVERHYDGRNGWTFEHAREQHLAHVLRDKAPATHRDYRSTLNSPDLAPLKGSWSARSRRSTSCASRTPSMPVAS